MADHRRKIQAFFSILLPFSIAAVSAAEYPPSADPSYYYSLCASSRCGGARLPYPFGLPTFCHHPSMNVSCSPDNHVLFSSGQQTGSIRVVGNLTVDGEGSTITVASDSLFSCGRISDPNYSYGVSIFSLPNNYTFGTHLNCTRFPAAAGGSSIQPAACLGCNNQGRACFYSPGFVTFPECERFYIFLPVGFNVSAEEDLRGYLQRGFPIRYSKPADCRTCGSSGGLCGSSPTGDFVCYCPSAVHNVTCSGAVVDISSWAPAESKSSSKTLIISTCVPAGFLLVVAAAAAVFLYKKHRRRRRRETQAEEDVVAAITQTEMKELVEGISPARYSYSQIKKITGNFKTKIGEGGSGDIYKGGVKKKKTTKKDGGGGAAVPVPVAVKVLKETKQTEKQFMNEVATVGRIHHHNLVALLGYCAEGRKRALVYEYLENGSLDKFIGDGRSPAPLDGDRLRSIAMDTARGILYLHEGCRSRILHCDIKPHNVLLGADFSAKVADFGLARIADKDRSHVSITIARGTPGYAAPEMWSKSYGPITEKSDVYSYGMLLLEMAGVRDSGEGDGHGRAFGKVYEDMASQKSSNEDEGTMDKLCLVGLWCIQHIPANRPTMAGVIQMLSGDDEIPNPPYPFPVDHPTEPEPAIDQSL